MVDLHILNGDAIAPLFEQADIPGEVFVWAEVLCEGRSGIDLISEEHWQYRQAYLQETYSFFEQEKFDSLKNGFQALDLYNYKNIFLWFEYDLFCQINMIALLAWLSTQNYKGQIRLICVGEHPDYDKLVSLGELTPTQFTALLENPHQLKEADLQTAATLWTHWCSGQHDDLLETSLVLNQERFPYVKPALQAHLKRFPYDTTLLTEIENYLIQLIKEKPQSAKALVGQLLSRDNYYGFGDVQYFNIIENLKLIMREDQGLLYWDTSADEDTSNTNSKKNINREFYFGGASQKDYFYSEEAGKLIK